MSRKEVNVTNGQMAKDLEEIEKLGSETAKELARSIQKEYIIGSSQPQEVIETQKGDLQNACKILGTQEMGSNWERNVNTRRTRKRNGRRSSSGN